MLHSDLRTILIPSFEILRELLLTNNMWSLCTVLIAVVMISGSRGFRILGGNRNRNIQLNGFFDDLKVIFSKEGQENIKSYKEAEKAEMLKAQQEILARRRDPKMMRENDEKIDERRKKLAEERAIYNSFQSKNEEGYDGLDDWKRLRAEGKVKIGKDLERDQATSRLGSEGLIEVRVDERMPYIDQGYVDEDADVMGKFMNMFKKKKWAMFGVIIFLYVFFCFGGLLPVRRYCIRLHVTCSLFPKTVQNSI